MDNDIILALIGGGVTVIVALINKDKICKCQLCPVENMESVEERNDVCVCNTNTPFMCNGEILLCTRCIFVVIIITLTSPFLEKEDMIVPIIVKLVLLLILIIKF